jgi:hypothetical protein
MPFAEEFLLANKHEFDVGRDRFRACLSRAATPYRPPSFLGSNKQTACGVQSMREDLQALDPKAFPARNP